MERIKTVWPQRILKIILWSLVAFLVLRGVGSIMKPDTASEAQKIIASYKQQSSSDEKIKNEASAFAELFAREYFSYRLDQVEYSTRLSKYTSLENIGTFKNRCEVSSARAYKAEVISADHISVDVTAQVKGYIENQVQVAPVATGTATTATEYTPQDLEYYIRVSVCVNNGNYTIDRYPVFIPAPIKAQANKIKLPGDDVKSDEMASITTSIENFLKTYCTCSTSELAYYLKDVKKDALFKQVEYNRITLLEAKKKDSKYYVNVEYEVTDPVSKQTYKQSLMAQLVYKDNRYLIENFDNVLGGN